MAQSNNFGLGGINNNVQFGIGGGRLKNVNGVLEHRDATDTGYAIARGADPIDANDLATKRFVENRGQGRYAVTGQIDGGAVPNTTIPGEIFIVTTDGGGFLVNELWRGDGLGGTGWTQIFYGEGAMAAITDPLLGGTNEFTADRAYLWDLDASAWKDVGSIIGLTGVQNIAVFDLVFGSAASNLFFSPVSPIIVSEIKIKVATPFNGATVSARVETNLGLIHMPETEINLRATGLYVADALDTNPASVVNVIYNSDTSTAGAAKLLIAYSNV